MKITSAAVLIFLCVVILFTQCSRSTESGSSLGIQKAVDFLVKAQFNESLGLCREAPNVAPDIYWLVSDNLWAWKALQLANDSGVLNSAADAGATAAIIRAKLVELAVQYQLPRDMDGLPIDFSHEAVIGNVALPPFRTETNCTLHNDGYVLNVTMRNGTNMADWDQYADLLLYAALSHHRQGDDAKAMEEYQKAVRMWNETSKGLQDKAVNGTFSTYKLALLLYTSKALDERLNFESEILHRIYAQQNESNGGIMTDYLANGTAAGDANTETTSIVIIALLTSPEARLGIFAFYYPWYSTPNVTGHWDQWCNQPGELEHNPDNATNGRRDIAAVDYPLAGVYDSGDSSVIENHIDLAKEAGIDCFVISWWGGNTFSDNVTKQIRNLCEQKNFNFTFYLESPATVNQTVDDITYLLKEYGDSSSLYRIKGRPVIFVYSRTRNCLNPQEWDWHACMGSIDNDTNPTRIENTSTHWSLSEKRRNPPRGGIIEIQPFENASGYVVTSNPISLQNNEQYAVNLGISDVRNDSKSWSDVGMKIKIGLDKTCNDTLYDEILNFTDGWIDRSINVTRYAGQNVYLMAESYNGGKENSSSEWAAVDYLFINNSIGEIVSPDPFFDNDWTTTIQRIRERGADPYVVMDFGNGGYEEDLTDFVDYFGGYVDGIHVYIPANLNDSHFVSQVYSNASKLAHSNNMSFIATVMPGFDNNAIMKDGVSVPRNNAAYYDVFWKNAKMSLPDGYVITSFNEWREGTEIEPSIEYGNQYVFWTFIEFLTLHFNNKLGSSDWRWNADLNKDGVANMRDIQKVILNFDKHEKP